MESIHNGRAKIESGFDGTTITVPTRKNWFVIVFCSVWLGGWLFGLIMASSNIFNIESDVGDASEGFLLFWLVGWSMGGLAVIALLLWNVFGKETLIINAREVHLKKGALGIGTNKVLDKTAVKNIRLNEVSADYFSGRNSWAAYGLGNGKVKFDYGMKTYSFALGVDDAEANYLVDFLKQRI